MGRASTRSTPCASTWSRRKPAIWPAWRTPPVPPPSSSPTSSAIPWMLSPPDPPAPTPLPTRTPGMFCALRAAGRSPTRRPVATGARRPWRAARDAQARRPLLCLRTIPGGRRQLPGGAGSSPGGAAGRSQPPLAHHQPAGRSVSGRSLPGSHRPADRTYRAAGSPPRLHHRRRRDDRHATGRWARRQEPGARPGSRPRSGWAGEHLNG